MTPYNKKQYFQTITAAFKSALPIITGYIPLGSAFGLMAFNSGWGPIAPVATSVFLYAGAAQFMAIELVKAQMALSSYLLTIFLLNSRHMFYGLSVFNQFQLTKRLKPYVIFGLTDETYAVFTSVSAPETVKEGAYYFFIALFSHLSWILGTLLGVFAGAFTSFNTQGLDFALTALFIVILTEQFIKTKNKLPFIIGGTSAMLSLIFLGAGQMLLGCAFLSCLLLLLLQKHIGKDLEHHAS